MKFLISGASGLVGTALAATLRAEGHKVARLTRSAGSIQPGDIRWDPNSAFVDVPAMENAEFDIVVNLSGASIADGRWTDSRKRLLRSSRLDSTRILVDSLARLHRKPQALLSASAVGYYGSRGNEILTESSGNGMDFLGLLARDWEAEAARAQEHGIRTVIFRFGVILSAEGGALAQMLKPFRMGVGGRLGSGEQWMSWIALEDTIGVIRAAITDENDRGPINVVAPNPVRNSEFTQIIARLLHRRAILNAPAFALRLALGEMADALLLSSQRAVPSHLQKSNYRFRYENIEDALRSILAK